MDTIDRSAAALFRWWDCWGVDGPARCLLLFIDEMGVVRARYNTCTNLTYNTIQLGWQWQQMARAAGIMDHGHDFFVERRSSPTNSSLDKSCKRVYDSYVGLSQTWSCKSLASNFLYVLLFSPTWTLFELLPASHFLLAGLWASSGWSWSTK